MQQSKKVEFRRTHSSHIDEMSSGRVGRTRGFVNDDSCQACRIRVRGLFNLSRSDQKWKVASVAYHEKLESMPVTLQQDQHQQLRGLFRS